MGGRDGGKGHRLGLRKKMRSYILRLIEIVYIVKKNCNRIYSHIFEDGGSIVKEKIAIAYSMIDAPAVAFRVPDYCVRGGHFPRARPRLLCGHSGPRELLRSLRATCMFLRD